MSISTAVEWADCTLDIITGCMWECRNCTAATGATRFCGDVRWNKAQTDKYQSFGNGCRALAEPFLNDKGKYVQYPFGFRPTFHAYRIESEQTRKKLEAGRSRRVLVSASGDMWAPVIPKEWITFVTNFVGQEKYAHNEFLFQTRWPENYLGFLESNIGYSHDNFWFGTSVTDWKDQDRIALLPKRVYRFCSFEPLLGSLDFSDQEFLENFKHLDWITIGEEKGPKNSIVTPEKEWILDILWYADLFKIPVFMSSGLEQIVGPQNMHRDFPKQLDRKLYSASLAGKYEADCIQCGAHHRKDEMYAVDLRDSHPRNGTYRAGYICSDCLKRWCGSHDTDIGTVYQATHKRGAKE